MRHVLVIAGVALAVTGGASAEVVARAADGMVAITPRGKPLVAYVRGRELVVAQRQGAGRWTGLASAPVATGSTLAAFRAGPAGPVAVVMGPTGRSLTVLRRAGARWVSTPLARGLAGDVSAGWPGLALDGRGLPVVAFTRWHSRTLYSQLVLAKIDARGAAHTQNVTAGGFPRSLTPPPAAPVLLANGRTHVVETFGASGAVGTIEWMPKNKTWIGLFLSAGRGGFPIGPMFAARGGSRVYAAWTEAFPGSLFGDFPVTLATHAREITEDVLTDQGITSGLVMTPHGPVVAANQFVSPDVTSFSFPGARTVWAGTISGRGGSELDGRIAGLAAVPHADAQDLLLARGDALSWFRIRGILPVHVALAAEQRGDGAIALSGHVEGGHGGHVAIYREHGRGRRETVAVVKLGAGGSFSFADGVRTQPTYYRAVYVDPRSGIPYSKLLLNPVPAPSAGE